MSKRVYVAGKMSGVKDWNFPAFFEASMYLETEGYTVYNPAEEDIKMGFDPRTLTEVDNDFKKTVMQHDLLLIMWRVDKLVLLDGWRDSKGAQVEYALAKFLGLPIYTLTVEGGRYKMEELEEAFK